jgi:hypothetical protein
MQLALKAMLKAAQMASRNFVGGDLPPPYTPPTSGWYMAPPPAYSANPAGYQVHTYCIYTTPTSGWYMAPPPAYSANPAGYQVHNYCLYTPPTSSWYMAPPPAYSANPAGYQVLLHLHTAHQWLVHGTASSLLGQPSRLSGTTANT